MQVKEAGKRLASVVAGCAGDAGVYGACVNAHFAAVSLGVCAQEFAAFKRCMQRSLKKRG